MGRRIAWQFEILRVAAYRRYLIAATVGIIGLYAYLTAMTWTVLGSTGSATAVGLYNMAITLPVPFAALPAGILADRLGPRGLMALSLMALAVVVALTAIATALDALSEPAILGLAVAFGIFDGAYVIPAQLLATSVAEPRTMGQAIGFSSITGGVGQLLGGPAGGFALAAGGPKAAFTLAVGCLVVASILVAAIPARAASEARARQAWLGAGDALMWIRRQPVPMAVIAVGAITAISVAAYGVLLPVVVRDILHEGPTSLGALTGASGFGAVVAAVLVAPLSQWLGKGRVQAGSLGVAGSLLAVLALSRSLAASMLIVGMLSAVAVVQSATAGHLLQSAAPPAMRGRLLALYGFVFFGFMTPRMLLVGAASDSFGTDRVLLASAVAALVGLAIAAKRYSKIWSVGVEFENPGESNTSGPAGRI